MNAEQTSMGAHVFRVQANKSSGLAAGVYFYKVLSSEGNLTGRLVLLK